MTRPNDVEFCFQLWPNGWSTAQLWVDSEATEFRLTYVFNDPLESLLNSALRLANDESSATIEWSDEPGTYILEFNKMGTEHHLLSVDISEYSRELPLHTRNDLTKTTNFCVVRDYWLHLVGSELRKIAESFGHKHYSASRDYTFPSNLYMELQVSLQNRRNRTK
jgi:hypothetical protein